MDLHITSLLEKDKPRVFKNIKSWGHFNQFLNIEQENGDRIQISNVTIIEIKEVDRKYPKESEFISKLYETSKIKKKEIIKGD